MDCKEFQKLPIDEQRRILADEAKEFAERQLPTFTVHGCPQGCVDDLVALRTEVTRLTAELADRKATIYRADKLQEIWYWQGDGFDDLESITCPILIPADTLRNVMNVGADTGLKLQAAEQARLEAVRELKLYRDSDERQKLYESNCRAENDNLKHRLTKAEEALRAIGNSKLAVEIAKKDVAKYWSELALSYREIARAALQPVLGKGVAND